MLQNWIRIMSTLFKPRYLSYFASILTWSFCFYWCKSQIYFQRKAQISSWCHSKDRGPEKAFKNSFVISFMVVFISTKLWKSLLEISSVCMHICTFPYKLISPQPRCITGAIWEYGLKCFMCFFYWIGTGSLLKLPTQKRLSSL